ncbi:MAG TPA: hypothetical protein VFD64_20935 [Gemmatimonadaceae bacterium]|nr:hypothetical protein [Gemmatimonadaceae bacterium]
MRYLQPPNRLATLAAIVFLAACRDAVPVGPLSTSPSATVAWPNITASAEWSEVARTLVRTRGSNAFQAVRNYADVRGHEKFTVR